MTHEEFEKYKAEIEEDLKKRFPHLVNRERREHSRFDFMTPEEYEFWVQEHQ